MAKRRHTFPVVTGLTSLLQKARVKILDAQDLVNYSPGDDYATEGEYRLEALWKQECCKNKEDASFIRACFLFIRKQLIISCILLTCSEIIGRIGGVIIIIEILKYVEKQDWNIYRGFIYVVLLVAVVAIRNTFNIAVLYANSKTAIHLRTSILMLLYKRISTLRSTVISVGEVVNIITNDGTRIYDAVVHCHVVCRALLVLTAVLIFIINLIGVTALGGIVALLVVIISQSIAAKIMTKQRGKYSKIAAERVKIMNEILTYTKLIKMYVWENSFATKIREIRKRELKQLEKVSFLHGVTLTFVYAANPSAMVTIMLTMVFTGRDISVPELFGLIVCFTTLANIVHTLPVALKPTTEAIVAIKRIQQILEIQNHEFTYEVPNKSENALEVSTASFSCTMLEEKNGTGSSKNNSESDIFIDANTNKVMLNKIDHHSDKMLLSDINIEVKKSTLVGICGPIGSGKTSLLNALLGQLPIHDGHVAATGRFSYVPQQAWVMNATIRENITFNEDFDPIRYAEIIEACSLTEDLGGLEQGDKTEIGERGINLSGGQKQRVNLARALYSGGDIFLLDDPLSAVDAHVGKHIFHQCIRGLLKDKTVILVTHQLQYLQYCDDVFLLRGGRVFEHGVHDELMENDTEYSKLIKTHYNNVKTPSNEDQHSQQNNELSKQSCGYNCNDTITSNGGDNPTEVGKLITKEDAGIGSGKVSYLWKYIKYTGGVPALVIFILLSIIASSTTLAVHLTLTLWINAGAGNFNTSGTNYSSSDIRLNPDFPNYVTAYCLVFAAIFFFGIASTIFNIKIFHKASDRIHNRMFKKLIRAKMQFFDTTPIGRILNRFSKDMDDIHRLINSFGNHILWPLSLFTWLTLTGGIRLPLYATPYGNQYSELTRLVMMEDIQSDCSSGSRSSTDSRSSIDSTSSSMRALALANAAAAQENAAYEEIIAKRELDQANRVYEHQRQHAVIEAELKVLRAQKEAAIETVRTKIILQETTDPDQTSNDHAANFTRRSSDPEVQFNFKTPTYQHNSSRLLEPNQTFTPESSPGNPFCMDVVNSSSDCKQQVQLNNRTTSPGNPFHIDEVAPPPNHHTVDFDDTNIPAQLQVLSPMFVPLTSSPNNQFYMDNSVHAAPNNNKERNFIDLTKQISDALALQRQPAHEPDVYEGNALLFQPWRLSFETMINQASIPATQKLAFLAKYTKGDVKSLVDRFRHRHVSNPDEAYKEAWVELEKRFGNKSKIASEILNKLTTFPKLPDNDRKKVQEFADLCVDIAAQMQYLPSLGILNYPHGIHPVLEKLPSYLHNSWRKKAADIKQIKETYPPFDKFADFIKDKANRLNDPDLYPDEGPHKELKKQPVKVMVTNCESPLNCIFHESHGHHISDCITFGRKPISERREFCKTKGLCYRCGQNHIARNCQTRTSCKKCNSDDHASFMHIDQRPNPNANLRDTAINDTDNASVIFNQSSTKETVDVNTKCTRDTSCIMGRSCSKIILAKVYHKDNPSLQMRCYVVLDDQSNTCLGDPKVFNTLEINGPEYRYELSTCSGNKVLMTGRRASGLILESETGHKEHLPTIIENETIPGDRNEIPTPNMCNRVKHLKGIAQHIPEMKEDVDIVLLLGRNCPEPLKVRECRNGPKGAPWAQRTTLGWTIAGQICTNNGDGGREDIVGLPNKPFLRRGVPSDSSPIHRQRRYIRRWGEVAGNDVSPCHTIRRHTDYRIP